MKNLKTKYLTRYQEVWKTENWEPYQELQALVPGWTNKLLVIARSYWLYHEVTLNIKKIFDFVFKHRVPPACPPTAHQKYWAVIDTVDGSTLSIIYQYFQPMPPQCIPYISSKCQNMYGFYYCKDFWTDKIDRQIMFIHS